MTSCFGNVTINMFCRTTGKCVNHPAKLEWVYKFSFQNNENIRSILCSEMLGLVLMHKESTRAFYHIPLSDRSRSENVKCIMCLETDNWFCFTSTLMCMLGDETIKKEIFMKCVIYILVYVPLELAVSLCARLNMNVRLAAGCPFRRRRAQ